MARAQPRAQFVGVARIHVVENRVEVVALFRALVHQPSDGCGVFHALIVGVVLGLLRVRDARAVIGEVLREVCRQSFRREFCPARGLGRFRGGVVGGRLDQLRDDGIGGGEYGGGVGLLEKVSVNGIDRFFLSGACCDMARKLRVEYPGACLAVTTNREVAARFLPAK